MRLLNIKKWQTDKNIKFIFNILNEKNEETRFIGGCLRNLILKKKVMILILQQQYYQIKFFNY